ncbi:hypothetical protein EVAR_102914_1 [Eumeta japonica]|uniref:C2H2-type domain-containing protein n=1 Tax=Eumeta variegata TaxID=151549 RepID=A0A4C1ZJ71_EUMVA|nr:hypothetical protein EVAR_102914_1 [Eumeta japonica]
MDCDDLELAQNCLRCLCQERTPVDAGGLLHKINFSNNLPYVITKNIDVSDGIVNGSHLAPFATSSAQIFRSREIYSRMPVILSGDFNTDFKKEESATLTVHLREVFNLEMKNDRNLPTTRYGTTINAVFSRYIEKELIARPALHREVKNEYCEENLGVPPYASSTMGRRHSPRTYGTSEEKYECDYCKYISARKSNFRRHIRLVHNACGPNSLKTRTHMGQKVYKCDQLSAAGCAGNLERGRGIDPVIVS